MNEHTILVVDDIEQNIGVITQILKNSGFRVMAALSGATAIKIAQKRKPDLILLDVMMPDINGFETCQQLKNIPATKQIPVIFLSALNDVETKVKGFEVGGVDYITKPFQEPEVIARVKLHLRIADLEKEKRSHIDKLNELNEEKDKMMQIVSHDLRSPLGSIKGIAELLRDGEEAMDVNKVREFSSLIAVSSLTLINLVNDLLDLAKIESGSMALNLTEFDMRVLVLSCVETMHMLAYKKGIIIDFDAPDNEILMQGDKPKLMQVFNNIISNSVKFTNDKGNIRIKCSQSESGVHIQISDNGIGIPADVIPKLFEKFGKHQRAGTSGEKGTGLGMPIVKRFIELHGGKIVVESIVGEGSTFLVTLSEVQSITGS